MASQIAIGALRYFLLKFTRNSVIAFDFQEALSFEGETGPYVQYAAVRARNILRKLEEKGEQHSRFRRRADRGGLGAAVADEDFWQMLLAASKGGSAVERAVAAGEPAHVAKFAFQLAQAFNNFYHQYPDHSRGESGEEGVPAVDDGFLPPAAGTNTGRAGHSGTGVYVGRIVTLPERHGTAPERHFSDLFGQ